MRRWLVVAGLAVFVPAVWGMVSLGARVAALHDHSVLEIDPDTFPPSPAPSGRPVVAVLASNTATELTDLIAPFAILSATDGLDVVTVAPERRVSALTGGVGLLPHHSFASFEDSYASPTWVVVPAVMDPEDPRLVEWVARQVTAGAGVLSICEGARLAGRAGVLDGHRATSHFFALDGLEDAFPGVAWQRGPRVVEDANRISSAGVTAAIDAALTTAAILTGPEGAARARERLGLQAHRRVDEAAGFAGTGWGWALLAAAFRGGAGTMGVMLEPGVDEFALTAWLDALPRSLRVDTRTFSHDDQIVRGRHGLDLVPTLSVTQVEVVDDWARLAGPNEKAAGWAGRVSGSSPLQLPAQRPLDRTPFDTALTWLAREHGRPFARVSAASLEYPRAELDARWLAALGPDSAELRDLLVLAVLAAVGGVLPAIWWRQRRR